MAYVGRLLPLGCRLREEGCWLAQGFLFSEPLSRADFEKLLADS